MKVQLHHLSLADVDAIARGDAQRRILDVLVAGQRSKRRLLLLALRRAGLRESMVDEALRLLQTVEARQPRAVDDVLGRPLTNAWAIASLRDRNESDVGFAGAIAAAAAIRAAMDCEIGVPTRDGAVFLPGHGTASGLGPGTAVIRHRAGRVEVVGGDRTVVVGRPDGWFPSRSVVLTPTWALEIEDQDPYRDCFGWRPADRLSDEDAERFAGLLRGAWSILEAEYPTYSVVIRHTLRSVVPVLAEDDGAEAVSAASQLAAGAVAVSTPADAETMALLLIHEVQHMTLAAVLDIMELCQAGGRARHHAPWRLDPRPVQALLQGTFAHLGVTDYWRGRRHRAGGTDRDRAELEFAYWREMTSRATRTLLDSGELKAVGAHFVQGIADMVEPWLKEPVPPAIGEAVKAMADTSTVMWRLHNQRPASGSVQRLAQLYGTGEACPTLEGPGVQPGPPVPERRRGLSAAIHHRLFGVSTGESLSTGDSSYLAGEFAAAAEAYRAQIAEDPTADGGWVGLAAALGAIGDEPAATVLAQRPELVRAIYLERPTTPEGIAIWLAARSEA